jgi:hypothetical protein
MCNINLVYRTIMSKPRVGTQRYVFKPFEDESHLECICRLALRGRDVGAYLLKKEIQATHPHLLLKIKIQGWG